MVKETEDELAVPTADAAPDTPGRTPPGLDLQDLALALNLINTAIKRGTFERSELRSVLDVTDKVEAFLSFQAAAQASQHNQKGKV
jgi:hypothetical protein